MRCSPYVSSADSYGSCHVNVAALDEMPFDDPMNEGSGAAVIFGATGGVMEAALRSAYFLVNGTNPDPDAFVEVRGLDGWKEKSFDLGGREVRVAVASGLANAEKLLAAIDAGEVEYDFVEVMACPGGCAGGGGQPIHEARELAATAARRSTPLTASARRALATRTPT